MKTEWHNELHSIIKKIVILVENKKQLAEHLWISPAQVYCREDVGKNGRPIPRKYWANISMYVEKDIENKEKIFSLQKEFIEEFNNMQIHDW